MKYFIIACLVYISAGFLIGQTSTLNSNNKPISVLTPAFKPESAGFNSERLMRIDKNLTEWMKDGRLNGSVAMIVHNGKIVYNKAFGFDDLAKTKPLRTDHIYRIASQTKAITSVAIMMLYEEGKFLLDDPVSSYIPEFANAKVIDRFNLADTTYTTLPAKTAVTIRHLLTHTSGIGYPEIGSPEALALYSKHKLISGLGAKEGRLLADDVKTIGALPLFNQPGEKFLYGWNSDVLGRLVEIFSGMSLDDFFRKRIFEPLGMSDTYFYVPPSKHHRIVNIYREQDGKLVPPTPSEQVIVDYPKTKGTFYSGGAGLCSTVTDYAIFLQMMLNEGIYNGKRLLARNTVRMMTMNQIGDLGLWGGGVNKFGLGFGITTDKGSALLPTPEGVFDWGGAFSTTYWADPKENVIGLFFRQLWGSSLWSLGEKYKVLVYGALE